MKFASHGAHFLKRGRELSCLYGFRLLQAAWFGLGISVCLGFDSGADQCTHIRYKDANKRCGSMSPHQQYSQYIKAVS